MNEITNTELLHELNKTCEIHEELKKNIIYKLDLLNKIEIEINDDLETLKIYEKKYVEIISKLNKIKNNDLRKE